MPSFYAHYRFGSTVLASLPKPLYSVCTENRALFDIGLYGPDIFFFYRPFTPNRISRTGQESHGMTGTYFFERFAAAFEVTKEKDALLSYFCGFLCHLALDSVCHPEVYRAQQYTGQTHAAIETSFDRTLLLEDHLDPIRYEPCTHLRITRKNAEIVARIFSTISAKGVEKSLRSTVFCSRLLFLKNIHLRKLLRFLLRYAAGSESIYEMIMLPNPDPRCEASDKALSACCKEAETVALELLSEIPIYIESGKLVSDAFSRTFKGR